LLQKPYDNTHLTLGMLLHYPGKLNIQIFCRYPADLEENANKVRNSLKVGGFFETECRWL